MTRPLITVLALLAGSALAEKPVVSGGEARYRVREQLATLNFPNDAVGVTSGVSGSILLDEGGGVLAGSQIVVDAQSLQSDQARHDNYLRRSALESDRYPTVTFVPTEVREPTFPLPESGEATFEIVGELTVRGVTRPAVWRATATFSPEGVVLDAATAFTCADFEMAKPRVALVLSVV
jgi:polyisoprenoid-binding protein YceI